MMMDTFLSISIAVAGIIWFGFLIIAFFGKLIVSGVSQLFRHSRRWLQEAVEADAVILHIEQTGLFINNKPQVKLQMQVKPGRGRNFVIEINEIEDERTRQLKAGSIVRVKFNPRNFRELFLVTAA